MALTITTGSSDLRAVFFCGRYSGHFLHGVAAEMRDRNCDVVVCTDGPSPDLDPLLAGADLVIVEDSVAAELRFEIGQFRLRSSRCRLLLRSTCEWSSADLGGYDGVLAATEAIRESYARVESARLCWTWHEAADTALFRPLGWRKYAADLVWIGDWDAAQPISRLFEFLLEPAADLNLKVVLYGAAYPVAAQAVLRERGVQCAGPLASERIPEILSAFRVAVHIPPQRHPATRLFEALACGVPVVSAAWDDSDQLFTPGQDYLVAHSGEEMREQLRLLMDNAALCADLSLHGLQTILSRHTCTHRTDELLSMYDQLAAAAGDAKYAVAQQSRS